MKKANIITVGTAIALLLCAMAGYAAKTKLPYKITIGLSKDFQDGISIPTLGIAISNVSKNNSSFYLGSPTDDYVVDVRYRTTDAHNSSWLQIKPKFARIIKRSIKQTPGPHYTIKFRHKLVAILSGETEEEILYLNNYDMSAMGDYQVTLSMDLPDCTLSYHVDTIYETSDAKTITINSNTIYLRHTSDGFSDVTDQYKNKKKS